MKRTHRRRLCAALLLAFSVTATGTGAAQAIEPSPASATAAGGSGEENATRKVGRIDPAGSTATSPPVKSRPVVDTSQENCTPTAPASAERSSGAVEACVSVVKAPVKAAKSRSLDRTQQVAPTAAAVSGSCVVGTPATWYFTRSSYCAFNLRVLYTLKDGRGQPIGTGILDVLTSGSLPAEGTTWDEQVRVTLTKVTGSVTTVTAKFRAACSGACKATKPTPYYGGTLIEGKFASGKVTYAAPASAGAPVSTTTSYEMYVTTPGAEITDPNASWSNPEKIRCDDDVRGTASSPGAGCVVPSVMPVIKMSSLPSSGGSSSAGAAAAGYAWAQRNLADSWGHGTPLTRSTSASADRYARTCGASGSRPFQARTDLVPTDTCSDFPFSSSHEGGTDGGSCSEIVPRFSTGGWDIYELHGGTGTRCTRAHVPAADQQIAEAQLAQGYADQRVLEAEPFKVDIATSDAEPQAPCLQKAPSGALPSGNGWIKNSTQPVPHINKTTTPPGPAGVRAEAAQACLGAVAGDGSDASGDITGWLDAQEFARINSPNTSLARCHLIANILGGKGQILDGGQANLVPCWQVGMNTGTPSMRSYEQQAQKALANGTVGPNDAILYQVTPDYRDSTSTIPVGVTMSATLERADGSTRPFFPDIYISNTKANTGLLNLGN
ncbi:hypothetical protein AMK23_35085 [Streptomyces sp. CB02130]|nr:hypothetical protein AMK23_35085 [Streptomyces sp. CB02130]